MERAALSELEELQNRRAKLREEMDRMESELKAMREQLEEIRKRVRATAETPPAGRPQV
jgi:predicted  nucleic acid-binding Zn-ribbon protein